MNKKPVIGIYSIFISKYTQFYKDFIENINKYFLVDYDKIFYIVTDDYNLPKYHENTHFYYTERIGHPYETLYRYKYFLLFDNIEADIIYFLNSNALCTTNINDDILPDETLNNVVGTIHNGFYCLPYKNLTYDDNRKSTSYIPYDNNKKYYYYGGGFFGAYNKEFLELCKVLDKNVSIDEENNYIAKWHDESHLNYYLNIILNNNVKKLDIQYHIPEERMTAFNNVKIIYLDKTKHVKDLNEIKPDSQRQIIHGKIIKNKYNENIFQEKIKNINKKPVIGIYSIFISKYTQFYKDFIVNMTKYFLNEYNKIFYIVTDDYNLPKYHENTHFYYTERIGHPYDSLYRYKYFLLFDNIEADIIYFLNSNALCTTNINDDILPDETLNNVVGSIHNRFYGLSYGCLSYDDNINSTSYIPRIRRKNYYYYGGRFFGAYNKEFLELCKVLDKNVSTDEENNYIAKWYDESHLNYYLNVILNNNVKKLDISYHIPEEIMSSYDNVKIIYLDKTKHIKDLIQIKPEHYHQIIHGKIIKNKYNEKLNINFKNT